MNRRQDNATAALLEPNVYGIVLDCVAFHYDFSIIYPTSSYSNRICIDFLTFPADFLRSSETMSGDYVAAAMPTNWESL